MPTVPKQSWCVFVPFRQGERKAGGEEGREVKEDQEEKRTSDALRYRLLQ